MKKTIAILALMYSSITFAASIPSEYLGEWKVNCDSTDTTSAIFEPNYFNPDSETGMAKLTKIINNNDGSFTLYGNEEYWDEGRNMGGKSKINIRLDSGTLHISGVHHRSQYNLRFENCGSYKPNSRLSLFNIRLGMNPDEVEHVTFFRCLGTKCELSGPQPEIDGKEIYPSVIFDDDTVEVVQISFDFSSRSTIESALREKYGQPPSPLYFDENLRLYFTEWIVGNEHIKMTTHLEVNKPFYVILERLDQAQRKSQRNIQKAKSII